MDHEIKQAPAKHKSPVPKAEETVPRVEESNKIEENEQIEEVAATKNRFADRVRRQMESFAGTRWGQTVFRKTDRALKMVEDTAKWSLPTDADEGELERPLTWILFLCLIVYLRVFRFCYSLVANLAGHQPLTPKSMVCFLQNQRRRLRAIRFQGIKTIRNKESQNSGAPSTNQRSSFIGYMGQVVNSAICRPGQSHEPIEHVVQPRERDIDDTPANSGKRPRHETPDHELTVCEMLDKFAAEDSDNDPDYVPPEHANDDDNSLTSHNTTASAEETSKYDEEESAHNKDEDAKEVNPDIKEAKENGETEQDSQPKAVDKNQKSESDNKAKSENKGADMPKKMPQLNESLENGETKELPVAAAEVAPPQRKNTAKSSLNAPIAPQPDANHQKPTAGHETAATKKPQSTNTAETGSLQDFHTTAHPPTVARDDASAGEAKTSTAPEAASDESGANSSPESQIPNPKKNFYHPSHNKHHTSQHYYNAKNRNRNRR